MRLAGYPFASLRIVCFKCRRQGVYRTARLAERFGADCPLEYLREHLAGGCPDFYRVSAGTPVCGAHFPDLAKSNPREAFLRSLVDFTPPETVRAMWPFSVELTGAHDPRVVARAADRDVGRAAWEAAVKVHSKRTVIWLVGTVKLGQSMPE
jgi:hypothetical protein